MYVRRENENTEVQKKCRKQRKAGKVRQVIDGGGVQVGTSERPGRCQPSPLWKKSKHVYLNQNLRFDHESKYSLYST